MKITEVVIDASDKFKDRQEKVKTQRGKDFVKKITGLAQGMPAIFDNQRELEAMAEVELTKIQKLPNKIFNQDRLALAPLYKGFQTTVSLLQLLEWYTTEPHMDSYSKEDVNLAHSFVRKNIDKILDTVDLQRQEMAKLRDKFNLHKWPAPWGRYTRFSYVYTELSRSKEYFLRYKKKMENIT